MKKLITVILSGVIIASCSDKSKVVYINSQTLNKGTVEVSPQAKEKIKKIVSNDVKLPETKAEEIEKIVEREKAEVKHAVEKKVKEVLTPYKEEKIKKETALLKEPITPVKTPDVVLRILLLPYVDEDNSFHSGEYLFVKVEEGKWILGNYIKTGKEVTKEFNPLVEEK
ncbi:TraV family lipoprotein [Persephonella sp.]